MHHCSKQNTVVVQHMYHVYYTFVCVLHSCVRITQLCAYYTFVCVLHSCVCITQLCAYYTVVCVLHSCVRITQLCAYYTVVSFIQMLLQLTVVWRFFSTSKVYISEWNISKSISNFGNIFCFYDSITITPITLRPRIPRISKNWQFSGFVVESLSVREVPTSFVYIHSEFWSIGNSWQKFWTVQSFSHEL